MILRAEHLIKKYKSRTVVKDVSVQVEQGEIVGLLGPNGAGKTTSFYMIVGLITPNGGRIFLDDQEITKEPVYKRAQLGVGYLAQEASVFRRLSVEDNIRAVLEMTKMTKEEQKDRLEEMLDEFGLQHIRKSLGIQLSGGERRRTEIARALSIRPKFILLDEPFACISISIWSVSILMYLEITLVMSALISSIISGEQFTRSDIRRIFKRSFATWQELFLRKKCFIFILPLPMLFEKYRLLSSKKILPFRNPERESLFPSVVRPH